MIYESRKNEMNNGILFDDIEEPDDGALVHGIFIECGRWDISEGLCDARIGEVTSNLPIMWLKPNLKVDCGDRYEAPFYKTPEKAENNNFILSVLLHSKKPSYFWILRGTALVSMID
jgi:dynein heavy chain